MENATRTARGRKGVVLAAATLAGLLLLGSVAWACTYHEGILTVCEPPRTSYTNGDECSKVEGAAAQVGQATVSLLGSNVSVIGEDFRTLDYSVLFRKPLFTSNCHAHNPDAGVVSLLGTTGSPAVPNTVDGPDFTVGVGSGSSGGYNTVTTPLTVTGSARICTQEEPNRVDGQELEVTVV